MGFGAFSIHPMARLILAKPLVVALPVLVPFLTPCYLFLLRAVLLLKDVKIFSVSHWHVTCAYDLQNLLITHYIREALRLSFS